MSSGFVSGGTIDAPIERSDEWLAAQTEIEANLAARKAAEAARHDGRSLYETLEANKAAKQDAFEEANKLKNQFRSLDEDEIEFLDSVLESTRAEEDRVRRETREGLELFRRQQEEADKRAREGDGVEEKAEVGEEVWVAGGRKRKRKGEKEGLKGVKLRRASSAAEAGSLPPIVKKEEGENKAPIVKKEDGGQTTAVLVKKEAERGAKGVSAKKEDEESKPVIPKPTPTPVEAPLKKTSGLVDYGSDEDDDW